MDELIFRKRELGKLNRVGNAIAASSAVYFTTPITLPTGNNVIINCKLLAPSQVASNTIIFDFTANKTSFKKESSNSYWAYQYFGNDWYSKVAASKITKTIELKQSSGIFTLTFEDETIISSDYSRQWPSRTTNLRLRLAPHFIVKEITQNNSDGIAIHHMLPTSQNNIVGMIDTITGTFYESTNKNIYLTTI